MVYACPSCSQNITVKKITVPCRDGAEDRTACGWLSALVPSGCEEEEGPVLLLRLRGRERERGLRYVRVSLLRRRARRGGPPGAWCEGPWRGAGWRSGGRGVGRRGSRRASAAPRGSALILYLSQLQFQESDQIPLHTLAPIFEEGFRQQKTCNHGGCLIGRGEFGRDGGCGITSKQVCQRSCRFNIFIGNNFISLLGCIPLSQYARFPSLAGSHSQVRAVMDDGDDGAQFRVWVCCIQQQMSETGGWTQEQDRLLRWVYESSGLSKWSHIARRLQELGVKGRNGKQCKQRYVTRIDTSHPKEDWPRQDELRLFELHNQLGNKWAVIGAQLSGRTDNAVKNHFYSRLRKALKRLNRVIAGLARRELREVKPNVLYRIVEVAEEKFKEIPKFDREFSLSANLLKNQLLDYSYEEHEEQQQAEQEQKKRARQATDLLHLLTDFSATYKKRTRKGAGMTMQQDLLTPNRYQRPRRCNSENQQSQGSSSAVLSSDTSNFDDHSDDDIARSTTSARRRKSSADHSLVPPRIRTRAYSQGAREQPSELSQQSKPEQPNQQARQEMLQEQLGGLHIFEEQQLPPHPLLMKKDTSKYSRFSENAIEKQQYHFFEDSQIEMRILPELDATTRKESQYGEKLFN